MAKCKSCFSRNGFSLIVLIYFLMEFLSGPQEALGGGSQLDLAFQWTGPEDGVLGISCGYLGQPWRVVDHAVPGI